MNKETVKEIDKNKLSEWAFPDLSELIDPDAGLMQVADKNVFVPQPEPEPTGPSEAEIKLAELTLKEEALNQQQAELENLKNEYEQGIASVKSILEKIKNPLVVIEGEVIELMESIIKKTVKKIVKNEITTNPHLIHTMIHDIKSLSATHNSMVNVFVSEEDYNRLTPEENQPSYYINVNPALVQGDIIIKADFTEIRAILDERIDKIVRIDHG